MADFCWIQINTNTQPELFKPLLEGRTSHARSGLLCYSRTSDPASATGKLQKAKGVQLLWGAQWRSPAPTGLGVWWVHHRRRSLQHRRGGSGRVNGQQLAAGCTKCLKTQTAPNKQTHPLSRSFSVRAAHWQGSHLHLRSLNMHIYDLRLPSEWRSRHLPLPAHCVRSSWVPHPLSPARLRRTGTTPLLCLFGCARSAGRAGPSRLLTEVAFPQVKQVMKVASTQNTPSALGGLVLPHSLRLRNAHFLMHIVLSPTNRNLEEKMHSNLTATCETWCSSRGRKRYLLLRNNLYPTK